MSWPAQKDQFAPLRPDSIGQPLCPLFVDQFQIPGQGQQVDGTPRLALRCGSNTCSSLALELAASFILAVEDRTQCRAFT